MLCERRSLACLPVFLAGCERLLILLAADGLVYNVALARNFYGPAGPYGFMEDETVVHAPVFAVYDGHGGKAAHGDAAEVLAVGKDVGGGTVLDAGAVADVAVARGPGVGSANVEEEVALKSGGTAEEAEKSDGTHSYC